MKSVFSIGLVFTILTVLPGQSAGRPSAGLLLADETNAAVGPVVVTLSNGHVFAGDISPQTDGCHFWLHWERDSVAIDRQLDWDQVAKVSVVGEEFSSEDLQGIVDEIRRHIPVPRATPRTTIRLRGSLPTGLRHRPTVQDEDAAQ